MARQAAIRTVGHSAQYEDDDVTEPDIQQQLDEVQAALAAAGCDTSDLALAVETLAAERTRWMSEALHHRRRRSQTTQPSADLE